LKKLVATQCLPLNSHKETLVFHTFSYNAVIVVDVQNDFINGSLAAEAGDAPLAGIFALMKSAKEHGIPVFSTRDWHPVSHCSFQEQGGKWYCSLKSLLPRPVHCVADTPGADFPPGLPDETLTCVIPKGQEVDKDAYSGFEGTDLHDRLKNEKVKRVFVVGYCTEYCVRATAVDAMKFGFETIVVENLCAAVCRAGAVKAVAEMRKDGIKFE
jgi:nicotinamidase/pyrazinamidase